MAVELMEMVKAATTLDQEAAMHPQDLQLRRAEEAGGNREAGMRSRRSNSTGRRRHPTAAPPRSCRQLPQPQHTPG